MRTAHTAHLVAAHLLLLTTLTALTLTTPAIADGDEEPGQEPPATQRDETPVAKVNGQVITRADVTEHLDLSQGRAWRTWSPPKQAVAIKDVREQLIRLSALEQHVAKLDVKVTRTEVGEEIGSMRRELASKGKELAQALRLGNSHERFLARSVRCSLTINKLIRAKVGEAEIRAYFRNNPVQFEKQWRLRQILILTVNRVTRAPLPFEQQQAAREKIQQAKKELAPDASNFEALVAKYSTGPASKRGGLLPWTRLSNKNPKAFEDAMQSLEVGEVSRVILTKYGYHILKLEAVYTPKLEDAREPCILEAQGRYMRALLENARIERFDFATGKRLLPKTGGKR